MGSDDFLFDNDKKLASGLKSISISWLEYKNHTLFMTKMAKVS